jgi:hypothetical protein
MIPPAILQTSPADSSVRVAPDEGVTILFSEPMNRATVQDGLKMYPPPSNLAFHWAGRRLRVTWEGTLAPHTTYQLVLSANARDEHEVGMGSAVHVRFSTGDSLDPGVVRGVLRAKTLATKGVPMALYPETLGSRPDFAAIPPAYGTETDTAGAYEFRAVHLGGYTLHALYDRNRDGYIDPTTDLVLSFPEPIRLTPERSVADSINLIAVDPQAPAILSGRIVAADSLGHYRVEARADTDSVYVVARADRVGPGEYVLRVPPGRYRLDALRLAGPGDVPPRLVVPLAGVIEAKPEAEYPGRDFEFPVEPGGPAGEPAVPPEAKE